MLRAFKVVPPSASDRAPCRRRRRCIPSLRESASSLEDRVLLSGAGHGAPAADVARPLAETAAGQRVTALFESILHTDPTGQQLTHWVHALRSGVGASTLRKDLTAEAGRGPSAPASVPMTVVMGGSPSASASVAATSTGRSGMAAILANQTNSAAASQGLNVRQIPAGMSFTVSLSPGATPAMGEGTMTTTVNSGSATGMTLTGTMSSGGTMTSTGMMSSGGTCVDRHDVLGQLHDLDRHDDLERDHHLGIVTDDRCH